MVNPSSVKVSGSGGAGIDYWSYLLVEAILRQYGARPHGGKLHFNPAKTCRRSIRAYLTSRRSAAKWTVRPLPERSLEKPFRVTNGSSGLRLGQIRRNTTLRLFAGISMIVGIENPTDCAAAVTASRSRRPQVGSRSRRLLSNAWLLEAVANPSRL
jgi:hypothetical protein